MAAGASEGGWSCRKGEVQKEEEWILFPVDWLGGRSVVDVEQRKTLELDVAYKTQKNNLFSFFLPSFFDKKTKQKHHGEEEPLALSLADAKLLRQGE